MKTMIVHQLIIIVTSLKIVVGYLNNLQRNPQAYGYHCTLHVPKGNRFEVVLSQTF
jgi:hypothetical protein